MNPYWDNGPVQLYKADARSIPLPDQSVHCVVTSPPYFGLRVYKDNDDRGIGLESTVDDYIGNMVDVFREVRRVLRDDGVAWLNLGDSYGANYRGGGPRTASEKQLSNAGSEPFMGRNGESDGNRLGIPERVVLALQADGWIWRDTVIWAKKSAMPESVNGWRWERCRKSLGGSQKSGGLISGKNDFTAMDTIPLADWQDCPGCPKCSPNDGLVLRQGSWRCTSAHEYIFMLVKKMSYYSDAEATKVKNGVTAVVQRPDLMGQGDHFLDYFGLESPSAVRAQPPAGLSHASLFRVAVLAARAVLDLVQFDEDCGLLPFDTEKGQQLDSYFSGISGSDTPTVKRLTSLCFSLLKGNTTTEQFVGELNSLGLSLNQVDLLHESGTDSVPFSLPSINADRETAIGIQGSSDVGQLHLSVTHNDNYTPTTSTSPANRRSVWNDISPEPYGGSHFATFPSDLPRICIQASTSGAGCCSRCGRQWARVVERSSTPHDGQSATNYEDGSQAHRVALARQAARDRGEEYQQRTQTLGWRATCACDAPAIPATVLDPFSGTGTTCRAAQRLGRRAVGVDISEAYLEQAVRRLSAVTLPMGI